VQYDFGRHYPNGFVRKNTIEDNLPKPNKNISGLLRVFKTDRGLDLLEQNATSFLKELQGRTRSPQKYKNPGMGEDKLFESSYRHKHRGSPACICRDCHSDSHPVCDVAIKSSCDDLGCKDKNLVIRDKKSHGYIHVGSIASGDMVMMSAAVRDDIAKREGIVAFEMEGAGVWDQVPCIVVKGVCDYADCHKNSKWQNFAAATAASASKAILKQYIQTDRPRLRNITEDQATLSRSQWTDQRPSVPDSISGGATNPGYGTQHNYNRSGGENITNSGSGNQFATLFQNPTLSR